jgi:hypothetical protein
MVETAGQPEPGPFRFCRVNRTARIRAAWSAGLFPVGKLRGGTLGLLMTRPALMLRFNAAMISPRSGGHAQGILIGWPLGPLTAPSQSPAEAQISKSQIAVSMRLAYALPVGLRPLENPVSGTRLGSTSRLTGCVEAVEMKRATRTITDVVNFMVGTVGFWKKI